MAEKSIDNKLRRRPSVEASSDKTVISVTEDNETYGTILTCALRYAVGRRTYITGEVAEYITAKVPHLTNRTIQVMERDLASEIDRGNYGDALVDLPYWKQLLSRLRDELSSRGLNRL